MNPAIAGVYQLACGLVFVAAVSCNGQAGGGGATQPATPKDPVGHAPEGDERLALAPFQKSALTLVGSSGGKPNASTFERLGGRLVLRDEQPASLELHAEPTSLVSSSEPLLARLKDRDVFDAKTGTSVVLRAGVFRAVASTKDAATHLLTGELVVSGKTLPVTVPTRVEVRNDAVTISIQTSITPLDWARAFAARPSGLFDERLDVIGKLVFPRIEP